MHIQQFQEIVKNQLEKCQSLLVGKAEEYATGKDRLSQFKVAAALENTTCRQAVSGMMAKHTTTVHDWASKPEDFPLDAWDEKITDSINYLMLLKAVLVEEQEGNKLDITHQSKH